MFICLSVDSSMRLSGQTFCLGAKRLRHQLAYGIFARLLMSYDDFVGYIVLSEYFQIKKFVYLHNYCVFCSKITIMCSVPAFRHEFCWNKYMKQTLTALL